MKIEFEVINSKNDFQSYDFNIIKEEVDFNSLVIELKAAYEWYRKRSAYVGLDFAKITGTLKNCTAKTIDMSAEMVQITRNTKESDQIARGKTNQAEVKMPSSLGELKLVHSQNSNKTEGVESTGQRKTRYFTFFEFARGKTPEWHFKPHPENLLRLLEGHTVTNIQLNITPNNDNEGVFYADTLPYLQILDSNGDPVSPTKKWLLMAIIKKKYRLCDIKITFKGIK